MGFLFKKIYEPHARKLAAKMAVDRKKSSKVTEVKTSSKATEIKSKKASDLKSKKAHQESSSDSDSNSDSSDDSSSSSGSSSDSLDGSSSSSSDNSSSGSSSSDDSAGSDSDSSNHAAASSSDAKSDDSSASEKSSDSSSSDDEEEVNGNNKRGKSQDSTQPPKRNPSPESSSEGSKTLFVGNLSFKVDKDWLHSEFESCGQLVDVRIVHDRATGRPKGFGYVQFADHDSVVKGLELKGRVVDGRPINVDFSTDKAPSPQEAVTILVALLLVNTTIKSALHLAPYL